MRKSRSEPVLKVARLQSETVQADNALPKTQLKSFLRTAKPESASRLSSLRHYSAAVTPVDTTVLPGEIPTAEAQLVRSKSSDLTVRHISTFSLSQIGVKAVSKNGTIAAVIYVILATMLAVSTYGLDLLANKPINIGTVEQTWFHDIFNVPVTTFLQGKTTVKALEATWLLPNHMSTSGTQSLSDLQYDTCGVRDTLCADKLRPNTELVWYRVAQSFALISDFDVPELAASPDNIAFQYVNTLSGYNFPAVQFYVPGVASAVACSVRRSRYRVAQEADGNCEIDSVAFCSKRAYDPEWGCENEVTSDTTTYIIKVKQGTATYLGSAPRSQFYYNPGNVARLTGSAQGTGFLSTVIGIDEYNGDILQSAAPWDMAPAYLCKGTFDPTTNAGMRWQGQGAVTITWKSSSLMVTNSYVLWSIIMSLAVIQFLYLPNSSVCVIPVNMAKSVVVGPVILAFACYGNYNVQVLTTFLNVNKVTTFDATPYRLAGPVMFSSVIAIMSSTAIQMFFNPLLASPSYVLTIVSVANWIIIFVLEAFVFPTASVTLQRECVVPSSTTCSYFSATVKNFYLSPIIGACAVVVGILVVYAIERRAVYQDLPPTNSVFTFFGAKTVRDLSTSGAGGCVMPDPDGIMLVDAGVLLNMDLVRVSSSVVVWFPTLKYAILYRMLPTVLANTLSRTVGLSPTVKAHGGRVKNELAFLELKDMHVGSAKFLPGYYS